MYLNVLNRLGHMKTGYRKSMSPIYGIHSGMWVSGSTVGIKALKIGNTSPALSVAGTCLSVFGWLQCLLIVCASCWNRVVSAHRCMAKQHGFLMWVTYTSSLGPPTTYILLQSNLLQVTSTGEAKYLNSSKHQTCLPNKTTSSWLE